MIIIQNKDNFRLSEDIELSKRFKQDAINIYGNHTLNENWNLTYSDDEFDGVSIESLDIPTTILNQFNEYNQNKKDLMTLLNAILDGKYSENFSIEIRKSGKFHRDSIYSYTNGYAFKFEDQPDLVISEMFSNVYETTKITGRIFNPILLQDEGIKEILKEYPIFHDEVSGEPVGIKVNGAIGKIYDYLNTPFVKIFKSKLKKQPVSVEIEYTETIATYEKKYYKTTFNKISCMLTSEETSEIDNKIKIYFDNIDKNKLQERLTKITN